MIEGAENILRDLDFYEVRVRHHELGAQKTATRGPDALISPLASQPLTHLARIELGASEIPKLLEGNTFTKVAVALKQIGYAHVTLDLAGYRRGSVNEIAFARREGEADRQAEPHQP
jgi:pyridinium-3,5-biscarboxylic acid mononucleotide sulfurtransferase